MTERGAPMTPAGFRKFLARLGVAAKFPFGVHPHMLRHACGYDKQPSGIVDDLGVSFGQEIRLLGLVETRECIGQRRVSFFALVKAPVRSVRRKPGAGEIVEEVGHAQLV